MFNNMFNNLLCNCGCRKVISKVVARCVCVLTLEVSVCILDSLPFSRNFIFTRFSEVMSSYIWYSITLTERAGKRERKGNTKFTADTRLTPLGTKLTAFVLNHRFYL